MNGCIIEEVRMNLKSLFKINLVGQDIMISNTVFSFVTSFGSNYLIDIS